METEPSPSTREPKVAFVRTDDPSPMHEVALNLYCTDGDNYVDVRGSAVMIAPGLALTARHNVEIFRENYEAARRKGEARGLHMFGVQSWVNPPATIVHRVARWFAAPWTDLAVLQVAPASELPSNHRWRCVTLELGIPAVGAPIAAFGYDDVAVSIGPELIDIRARGATTTGVVREVLDALPGNSLHGWPRFMTNARFDGGMSGGPVMSAAGRLCGVVSTSMRATNDDEEHASFVPLLWPAMAIEVELQTAEGAPPSTWTLLDLVRAGKIGAFGHEHVKLSFGANGRVNGISYPKAF